MTSTGLSGRNGDHIQVTDREIDPAFVLDLAHHRRAGAVVLFLGTVRDHAPGREGVTHLEYEAYEGVVEPKIAEVVAEARGKWPVQRAVAIHRTGSLDVGELAVAVAVSSAHRSDAFAASSYIIDELKARAPIWKKEHWPGGAEWVREDERHS
jgi:molybdopterin synthase catalytic subunit